MEKKATKKLVRAALIAAFYAGLTYSGFGIAYGPVQLRFSEALVLLSALTPAAIPGLTVGCLIANIGSTYGVYDMIFGTLATFFSAFSVYAVRKIRFRTLPLFAPVCVALINGLTVGMMIAFIQHTPALFPLLGGEIFLSEFLVTGLLGLPLYAALQRLNRKHALFQD